MIAARANPDIVRKSSGNKIAVSEKRRFEPAMSPSPCSAYGRIGGIAPETLRNYTIC